jgi:hypothetical protein
MKSMIASSPGDGTVLGRGGTSENTLETSEEDEKLHSKRVEKVTLICLTLNAQIHNVIPGNLQSYWNTKRLRKLTVVLEYQKIKETYSRIGKPKD